MYLDFLKERGHVSRLKTIFDVNYLLFVVLLQFENITYVTEKQPPI